MLKELENPLCREFVRENFPYRLEGWLPDEKTWILYFACRSEERAIESERRLKRQNPNIETRIVLW